MRVFGTQLRAAFVATGPDTKTVVHLVNTKAECMAAKNHSLVKCIVKVKNGPGNNPQMTMQANMAAAGQMTELILPK